jgi:hypothetical protein
MSSVEDKKEAPGQMPCRRPAEESAVDGGLRGLIDDVVPLEEMGDELDRQRSERVAMLVGRRRRLPFPRLRRNRFKVPRPAALAAFAVLAVGVLLTTLLLSSRGGDTETQAARSASPSLKKIPLAAPSPRLASAARAQAAHTRRRAALTAERKDARRRASRSNRHKAASRTRAPQAESRAVAPEPAPAEPEAVEAPTSTYGSSGSEETYEPPAPTPEAPPSPEEAAASEFNFESHP